MDPRPHLLPILLALAGLTTAKAWTAPLDFDLGLGYASSTGPSIVTLDSNGTRKEKARSGDFAGIHLTGTLSMPLKRWLSAQAALSVAWEDGRANHPATDWEATSLPQITVPGGSEEAKRKTYGLLAGIRIQDQAANRRLDPWATAQVGWSVKYLDPKEVGSIHEHIFYAMEEGIIQYGITLGLGVGADMQVWRKIGLRIGVEYQPLFAFEENALGLNVSKSVSTYPSYHSMQEINFVGEVLHQWRVTAGPTWGF